MFQTLRQGSQIYVLEKSKEGLTMKVGQVVKVGTPTAVYNSQTNGILAGFPPKMEFTIRASVDGQEGDFGHLLTDESVHDYGSMIVADSKESAISVVDTQKHQSLQELGRTEFNEKNVKACDEIFKALNPEFAKEQARDEALKDLNNRFNDFEQRMGDTLSNIEKLLAKGAKS